MFVVYILYSEKLKRYYTGTTDDVEARLAQHNSVHHADAFTADGMPWILKFVINDLNSKQAYAIEKHIKSMKSKVYIGNLLKYPEMVEKLKVRFH